MYVYAAQFGILLMLSVHAPSRAPVAGRNRSEQTPAGQTASQPNQSASPSKQLFAVRGEVTKMETQSKGLVAITVRPAHDPATVTVIARENDIVGAAVGRQKGADLVGLLAGEDQRENERITAAEIREGDLISVIYDPLAQNRALEIYMH
jgi:hypothetical protein